MRVLILTEGSKQIGYGHIVRCTSLYDEVLARGVNVELIINGSGTELMSLEGRKVRFLDWTTPDFLINSIKGDDYCIIDSYIAQKNTYEELAKKAFSCLYIDDYNRIKYPKGVLVNPSLNTDGLYEDDVNCFSGPDYVILRKSFLTIKGRIVQEEVKQILIMMGGTDVRDLTLSILEKFSSRYSNITFHIVMGSVSSVAKKDLLKRFKNVAIYQNLNQDEMKILMDNCDFAITAAGQTIYELLVTQTPFIPVIVAQNQKNNIQGLKRYDLIDEAINYNIEHFLEHLDVAFERLFLLKTRQNIVIKYKNAVDGKGSARIVDLLFRKYTVKDQYYLRMINNGDIEAVFTLSNKDYVREYSINKDKIIWEDHVVWFRNILDSKNNIFYAVTNDDNKFLGQIRYKICDTFATVSISLCEEIMGKGMSSILLTRSIELLKAEKNMLNCIVAFVSENNIPSKKLFIKSGFYLDNMENGLLKYHFWLDKEHL